VLFVIFGDGMIITGEDTTGISNLRDLLSHNFEMKVLSSLNYFLGLEVLSSTDGLLVSQAKYASDLIAN
jgi:hypothetical protein